MTGYQVTQLVLPMSLLGTVQDIYLVQCSDIWKFVIVGNPLVLEVPLQKKMTRPQVWLHDAVGVHLLDRKLCMSFC